MFIAAACGESESSTPDTGVLEGDDAGGDGAIAPNDGPDGGMQLSCGGALRSALTVLPSLSCMRAFDAFVHHASLCERCTDEGFGVRAQVGNRGSADIAADALQIEIFGTDNIDERVLAMVPVRDAIASGEVLESVEIVIDDAVLSDFDAIGVRVNRIEGDCEPGNDVLGVIGPFCVASH